MLTVVCIALKASFALRIARDKPTQCPQGEFQGVGTLLLTSLVLLVGGHLSVRRFAPAFRLAWTTAVTVPIMLQGIMQLLAFLTCLDTQVWAVCP